MGKIAKLLDSAIAEVAPGWAAERAKSRAILAISGYHGASISRPALAGFRPAVQDADDDIGDLRILRARSRDLARNAPLAGGAINTNVTHVVGTGLSLQPAIDYEYLGITEEAAQAWQDNVLRRWRAWAEVPQCDVTRHQNFYGLQSLAFRSMLESGDVFILMPMTSGRLALQLVEADRISNPDLGPDTSKRVAGVELDDAGAPVAYHIAKKHPGRLVGASAGPWQRVEAFGPSSNRRNVLHLFERLRPGQTRGVPYLAPVIEPLKQLARYTEAELQAAVISAAFALFIKMDPQAFQELFDDNGQASYLSAATSWDGSYPDTGLNGPGKAVNLLPGEEPVMQSPGRPNEKFDPFFMALARQIGLRLEIPLEVLLKHFTSSYSAARAALLDAWRVFRCRREFLATYFCQPIYEEWLAWEISNGRISAPGFFADEMILNSYCGATWVGDGPGSIDPTKDVEAARARVEMGISTLADESILYDGVDWRTKHNQRVREVRARKNDGLEMDTPAIVAQ